jgi:hypothetical protein
MQPIEMGWFNILSSYDFYDERDMSWTLAYKIGIESLDGKVIWFERIDPPRL